MPPRQRPGVRRPSAVENEKKEPGFRLIWAAIGTAISLALMSVLIAAALNLYASIRWWTIPTNPLPAVCLSDESSPFFVPCKDREEHNKQLLEHIMNSASDLSDESIVSSSVSYMLSLSMRTRDKELNEELVGWMKIIVQTVQCTKLISMDQIDFQNETPRGICAEAKYKDPFAVDHTHALEEFNTYCDMAFIMSIYGSEFHEGALGYLTSVELEWDGKPVNSPLIAYYLNSFYTRMKAANAKYSHLMTDLYTRLYAPDKIQTEQMGVYLLANGLEKMMTTMRRCNPPAKMTWMDYHSRAAFKSVLFKGKDDECGWTTAPHSNWEIMSIFYYDIFFNIRWMLGYI